MNAWEVVMKDLLAELVEKPFVFSEIFIADDV